MSDAIYRKSNEGDPGYELVEALERCMDLGVAGVDHPQKRINLARFEYSGSGRGKQFVAGEILYSATAASQHDRAVCGEIVGYGWCSRSAVNALLGAMAREALKSLRRYRQEVMSSRKSVENLEKMLREAGVATDTGGRRKK